MVVEAFLGRLPEKRQDILRPWMWLAPALVFLSTLLIYPTLMPNRRGR